MIVYVFVGAGSCALCRIKHNNVALASLPTEGHLDLHVMIQYLFLYLIESKLLHACSCWSC